MAPATKTNRENLDPVGKSVSTFQELIKMHFADFEVKTSKSELTHAISTIPSQQ